VRQPAARAVSGPGLSGGRQEARPAHAGRAGGRHRGLFRKQARACDRQMHRQGPVQGPVGARGAGGQGGPEAGGDRQTAPADVLDPRIHTGRGGQGDLDVHRLRGGRPPLQRPQAAGGVLRPRAADIPVGAEGHQRKNLQGGPGGVARVPGGVGVLDADNEVQFSLEKKIPAAAGEDGRQEGGGRGREEAGGDDLRHAEERDAVHGGRPRRQQAARLLPPHEETRRFGRLRQNPEILQGLRDVPEKLQLAPRE